MCSASLPVGPESPLKLMSSASSGLPHEHEDATRKCFEKHTLDCIEKNKLLAFHLWLQQRSWITIFSICSIFQTGCFLLLLLVGAPMMLVKWTRVGTVVVL